MAIAVWHDFFGVRIAKGLDDRASFWCDCDFSGHEPTPERTAVGRLRAQLATHGLGQTLFEVEADQLRAGAFTVKIDSLADATVIASTTQADPEAGYNMCRPEPRPIDKQQERRNPNDKTF